MPTLLAVAVMVVASCANNASPEAKTPSPSPSRHSTTQLSRQPVCDPGLGHPRISPTCPDGQPETGWLRGSADGALVLAPFRTLGNNAAGRAYAQRHHLEFPFPNDYFDAPLKGAHPLRIVADTVCTGSIRVEYREPLKDHRVSCESLIQVASASPLPVAVWVVDGHPIQVSELYRP